MSWRASRLKVLGMIIQRFVQPQERIEVAERQLNEGVENLEATLLAQRDLASTRLKSVEV